MSLLALSLVPLIAACQTTTAGSPDAAVPRDASLEAAIDASDAASPDASGPCGPQSVVTFVMDPVNDSYNEPFGEPGDGDWWYSVATADGSPVQIFLGNYFTTCTACDPQDNEVGSTCQTGVVSATWNGVELTGGASTCMDGGIPNACGASMCAPPGDYVVTMCANTADDCSASGPDANPCVSVPFHYPTTAQVYGMIPD